MNDLFVNAESSEERVIRFFNILVVYFLDFLIIILDIIDISLIYCLSEMKQNETMI